MASLAQELATLRSKMKELAQSGDEHEALTNVIRAQEAAEQKERSKVFEHLKRAGQWALDVATKIGVPLVVEALKIAAGLK